ncbi:Dihydrolipoyllysine-residue succinyltransferase component of 2-oxoglutarate dehydrogenase complex [Planctomycetes bacterium Pan216]|uniref:Dihydrolipoyllysine-residue succinyltransferase component of 2-oxoglutarate dehydrogenase complex n=1 Tax=Kolteria novifilia TaxID=2527975 RepID=A0A518B7N9_9BACT|nr:Dihydrolipoyllysine-residue succinyltransferase component of 2-oxoglutarate dehydrogenase complex [Planctomycetes bacterium Pan216]
MVTELQVPEAGESITEVEIGNWLFAEGDVVEKDETLVEIDTAKAVLEVPSPIRGRLVKILKKEGDPAAVGDIIAHLEEVSASEASTKSKEKPSGDSAGKSAPTDSEKAAPATPPASSSASGETAHVMPAAAHALAERGLKASDVTATGPGGRLLKEDVLRHDGGSKAASAAAPSPSSDTAASRQEEVVPMTLLRKRVASRLVEAQQTAALLTTFNEVDMSGIMALRKQYQESFVAKHGIKLGFMSFFVKAVIEALKDCPALNAEIRGTDIVYRNFYDIGIAVGGGKGLVVPIIRSAERLGFAEIEKTIADFGKRAKSGALKVDELEGGTFTISNGGVFGSMLSTPIINPPQSGILGMHAIQERPVARDGQVVIRPMMYTALTYDHRIVDGREAVTFLVRIKEVIENPARILLEV